MGERIKQLRKALGLTQTEFGEQVGLTRSAMQNIEYGRNGPSRSAIQLICNTFSVNERWLVAGEGDMFEPIAGRSATMAILGSKYENSPVVRAILDAYTNLPLAEQAKVERFVASIAVSISKGLSPEEIATLLIPTDGDS